VAKVHTFRTVSPKEGVFLFFSVFVGSKSKTLGQIALREKAGFLQLLPLAIFLIERNDFLLLARYSITKVIVISSPVCVSRRQEDAFDNVCH